MSGSSSKLLYYRGFYIAKQKIMIPNFESYKLKDNTLLFVHCEQKVKIIDSGEMKFWVIGTFFNLEGRSLDAVFDYESFNKVLYNTCGRFVILVKKGEELRVYGDPSNSMSYCFSEHAVASSPELCCIITNKNEGSYNKKIYDRFGLTRGFGYITNESSYEDVFWGTPNHYLDINLMKQIRFFPNRRNPFAELSMQECILEIKNIVEESMRCLLDRYDDVIMELTGGLDSRFAFVLGKKYINCLEFYTYNLKDVFSKDEDYGKKIAQYYKLNHTVYRIKPNDYEGLDEYARFREVTKHNNDIPQHIAPLAFLLFNQYHRRNAVRIYSRISEIGRAYLPGGDYIESAEDVYSEFVYEKKKDLLKHRNSSAVLHII